MTPQHGHLHRRAWDLSSLSLDLPYLNRSEPGDGLFTGLGISEMLAAAQGRPCLFHGFWPATRLAMLRVGFRRIRMTALPAALSIFRSSLSMT